MPDVTIRALRGLALATLTALAAPAALTAQSLFSPAITVNGDVISYYELDQRAQFLRLLGAPANPEELAREQLIEDRLKFQAAAEIGASVGRTVLGSVIGGSTPDRTSSGRSTHSPSERSIRIR